MGVWNMNPLIFIATTALGHIAVIALGAKDPHMSTMIQAFGQSRHISTNLYKCKGNKFAP